MARLAAACLICSVVGMVVATLHYLRRPPCYTGPEYRALIEDEDGVQPWDEYVWRMYGRWVQ